MKRYTIAAALVATVAPALAGLTPVSEALADEVIIHRDAPDVVEVPPPSRDVVIEHRRPDCATTTTRREDGYGSSTTTTRRDCD